VRQDSQFRNAITEAQDAEFPVESGRYHLYVSLACPWAHRTLITRALMGLSEAVTVSVVEPLMLESGWTFGPEHPDLVNRKAFLHEIYTLAQNDYTGRVTVPVLWDKQHATIVCNESAEIMRMLAGPLARLGSATNPPDLYPEPLRAEIDAMNGRIYETVNNGVYRSGFATTQEAYEEAVTELFETLDALEEGLGGDDFLVGNTLTEADIRLFTTLVRFDWVYHYHFKCNWRRLRDYPRLWRHTRRVYNQPGVPQTVNSRHIKEHYFRSHKGINPTQIVPAGPQIDFAL